jgi:hypothetical protein
VLFLAFGGKTLITYFSKKLLTHFENQESKLKYSNVNQNVSLLHPSFELRMDTMILQYLCEVKFILFLCSFTNVSSVNEHINFFFQFQDILGLSVELMAQAMTSELLDGCQDDKSVKAGFVGEIGCCYPMNGL